MVKRRRDPAADAVARALWGRIERHAARRKGRMDRMARTEAEVFTAADAFAQAARLAREALEAGRSALPRGPLATVRAVGMAVHEVVDGYLVRLPGGACGAAPTR